MNNLINTTAQFELSELEHAKLNRFNELSSACKSFEEREYCYLKCIVENKFTPEISELEFAEFLSDCLLFCITNLGTTQRIQSAIDLLDLGIRFSGLPHLQLNATPLELAIEFNLYPELFQ